MFEFTTAEILGAIALIIQLLSGVIYIRSILNHQTKPHLFTWVGLTLLVCLTFSAQLNAGAGAGAWLMGITALLFYINALLAIKYGEKNFTNSDKISIGAAILAAMLWLISENPLWTVIITSLMNIISFYPTLRKSWFNPYSENLVFYLLGIIGLVLSVTALEAYNLTTFLYPLVASCVNSLVIALCFWRRRVIPKST